MFTETELGYIKEKLLKKKKEIENQLNKIADKETNEEDYQTRFPNYGEGEENAYEVSDYSRSLPLEKQLEAEFDSINSALEKIEENKYGLCNACGREIEKDRLKIRPHALRCITCAKKD